MAAAEKWATATALGLRLALGAGFLSAVADRIGWWGPHGSGAVAWGDMDRFLAYTQKLLPYLSGGPLFAAGLMATLLEAALGCLLLLGYRLFWSAVCSGLLLASFALSMALFTEPEQPLSSSVFTASAAAFALAHIVRGGRVGLSLDATLRGMRSGGKAAAPEAGS